MCAFSTLLRAFLFFWGGEGGGGRGSSLSFRFLGPVALLCSQGPLVPLKPAQAWELATNATKGMVESDHKFRVQRRSSSRRRRKNNKKREEEEKEKRRDAEVDDKASKYHSMDWLVASTLNVELHRQWMVATQTPSRKSPPKGPRSTFIPKWFRIKSLSIKPKVCALLQSMQKRRKG